MRDGLSRIGVILGLCLACSGCHMRPDWGPPGTIGDQRARAVVHDPFPRDDLGPPIDGGRPKGFDQPLAEPITIQGSPYARQRVPVQRVPRNFGY